MSEVVLKKVTKEYDNGFLAVKSVDLDIKDREFMVLVGPSGCGKSTLLRMIAGLEDITKGELQIDGKIMNDVSPKDRDIAMVFQNYALYPHMTVFDNMAFGLQLRKFETTEIKKRVEEAAEILGLDTLLARKPKELSGGQRQRVAVGRAIVRKPKVFLFDEPLSNLDAKLRVQMRLEISRLHQKLGATMIYVTHDQTEAMTMGDRITVLKDGVIQQVDTPLNLYNNPANAFVASFIGSPSMNFFKGVITAGAKTLTFKGPDLDITLPESFYSSMVKYDGKEVLLGVRPEHIVVSDKVEKTLSFAKLVEVVEPVGNETFLYYSGKDTTYCIRVPEKGKIIKPGQELKFVVEADFAYFFSVADEGLIYSTQRKSV